MPPQRQRLRWRHHVALSYQAAPHLAAGALTAVLAKFEADPVPVSTSIRQAVSCPEGAALHRFCSRETAERTAFLLASQAGHGAVTDNIGLQALVLLLLT